MPASSSHALSSIRYKLAICGGKGGVGKSTVTVQLGRALSLLGWRVAIIDADVHGPSVRHLAPETIPVRWDENGVYPAESQSLAYMSVALLPKWKDAAIVRAPIANALIEQFLLEVQWGEKEILLIDFPGGTGDIPITVSQRLDLTGALLVTTPQRLALIDVRKAARHLRDSGIPILGVVENLCGAYLPSGEWFEPFGSGAGSELLAEVGAPIFVQLPFDAAMPGLCDRGESPFEIAMPSLSRESYLSLAEQLMELLSLGKSISPETESWRLVIQDEGASLLVKIGEDDVLAVEAERLCEYCPCLRCTQRTTACDKRARLLEIVAIGNYGWRLMMAGGCSQGVFTPRLLKYLAAEASAKTSKSLP